MGKWRHWAGALAVGLVVGGQGVGVVNANADTGANADTKANERRTYRGEIDGARYKVVVPKRWNRTLVLFSHGYYPEDFPIPGGDVALSNHPQTAEWLLDQGYALAASDYKGKYGYAVEPALTDQIALLDWFGKNVAKPRRTVATGQSMGGIVATLLAERNPGRFAGVVDICAAFDFSGYMNVALDLNFAVKTLLAPGKDIDLVRPKDPKASAQALSDAIDEAMKTPKGRARLALVGSFGNIPGWYSTYDPKPTELAEKIRQQATWVQGAYTLGNGPIGRADIERRAGGNPSWNVGVDYGRQLARSGQKTLVAKAYRHAGLNVKDDLERLADAPRISADRKAVPYLFRYGVARGTTPVPVLTIHNTGDGGAPAYGQRWYAGQVRRNGNPAKLRQTYVDRGSHCAFTAAEEVVTMRNLIERLDTGTWPNLSPKRLNRLASVYPAPYQVPTDFLTGQAKVVKPAFTTFTPGFPPRPSR
ncbi:alpha/beta hydrolase [Actinomadura fulvescens]|uniref:Alpha/beta hydrolase n=1 Tax=Actinomadura fulvescens TaxID=46160 RepID=A0ABP6DBE9_9ACTN